jgi:hypothetical protein
MVAFAQGTQNSLSLSSTHRLKLSAKKHRQSVLFPLYSDQRDLRGERRVMPAGLYWGQGGQFGPFEAQHDGWPNAGQVMRHFREKLGMSAAEFARMYSEELEKQGLHKKGKPGKGGRLLLSGY